MKKREGAERIPIYWNEARREGAAKQGHFKRRMWHNEEHSSHGRTLHWETGIHILVCWIWCSMWLVSDLFFGLLACNLQYITVLCSQWITHWHIFTDVVLYVELRHSQNIQYTVHTGYKSTLNCFDSSVQCKKIKCYSWMSIVAKFQYCCW